MNPLICRHPLQITDVYMGEETFSSNAVAQVSVHELFYLYPVSWRKKPALKETSFCTKKPNRKTQIWRKAWISSMCKNT